MQYRWLFLLNLSTTYAGTAHFENLIHILQVLCRHVTKVNALNHTMHSCPSLNLAGAFSNFGRTFEHFPTQNDTTDFKGSLP